MGGKAVDFDAGGDSNPDGTSAPKEGKVDSKIVEPVDEDDKNKKRDKGYI